jgi:hypothetical protein
MGVEDQKEEREVLDSIFPDEITGTLIQSQLQSHFFLTARQTSQTLHTG